MDLCFPAFGFLESMLDSWQSTVAEGQVCAQVDHRSSKRYEGRTIGHLDSPPSGSLFMNDTLTERPLSSRASSAYEQGRLSKVDMTAKRAHHLQEVCEKFGKVMNILFRLDYPLTQRIVCKSGRLLVGAR